MRTLISLLIASNICYWANAFVQPADACELEDHFTEIQHQEISAYLSKLATRTKRTLRAVSGSADVHIHKSGLVLMVAPLWKGKQIPIQAACSSSSRLSLDLCKIYEGIWMATPYSGVPSFLGASVVVRLSLSDKDSMHLTASLVRINDIDQLKFNNASKLQQLPEMIRLGDFDGIRQYFICQDQPTDITFVAVKNIWMYISGVASGPPSRSINLSSLIDSFPSMSVSKDVLKERISPIEDRLNGELSNDLHRANMSLMDTRMSESLRKAVAELLEIVIEELRPHS